jgi:signal transduction histidine kinase
VGSSRLSPAKGEEKGAWPITTNLVLAVRVVVGGEIVEVRDSGIGIPADEQERLFERFSTRNGR